MHLSLCTMRALAGMEYKDDTTSLGDISQTPRTAPVNGYWGRPLLAVSPAQISKYDMGGFASFLNEDENALRFQLHYSISTL